MALTQGFTNTINNGLLAHEQVKELPTEQQTLQYAMGIESNISSGSIAGLKFKEITLQTEEGKKKGEEALAQALQMAAYEAAKAAADNAIGVLEGRIEEIEEQIEKDEAQISQYEDDIRAREGIATASKNGTLDHNSEEDQALAAQYGITIKGMTSEQVREQTDALNNVDRPKIDALKAEVEEKRETVATLKADIEQINTNLDNGDFEANEAIFAKHGLDAEGNDQELLLETLDDVKLDSAKALEAETQKFLTMDTYEQVVFYTEQLREHKADHTKVSAAEMEKYADGLNDEARKILERSEDASAALSGHLNNGEVAVPQVRDAVVELNLN